MACLVAVTWALGHATPPSIAVACSMTLNTSPEQSTPIRLIRQYTVSAAVIAAGLLACSAVSCAA